MVTREYRVRAEHRASRAGPEEDETKRRRRGRLVPEKAGRDREWPQKTHKVTIHDATCIPSFPLCPSDVF
jgi:hypothetical protein